MLLNLKDLEVDLQDAIREFCEVFDFECTEDGIVITAVQGTENSCKLTSGNYRITYIQKAYIFRALKNLLQSKGNEFELSEACVFERFGIMLDCSRNGVYTVFALKKLIKILAAAGYNTIQLYTEDTYEIDGEPYFGYLRGRYSKAKLKELDAFAQGYGIELVPCIQTLAHLNAIMRWRPYAVINRLVLKPQISIEKFCN